MPPKSQNPVDIYRRAQKKKEQLKTKETREKRKRDDEELRELHGAMESELAALTNTAVSCSLTAAEKARRKELRDSLEETRLKLGSVQNSSGDTTIRTRGAALPSGLFDPLSAEHESVYARAQKRPAHVPEGLARNEYSVSGVGEKSTEHLPPPETIPDLPEDFMPSLPDEPLPPWHKLKSGPPKMRIMGGYPPPPSGPIPVFARTLAQIKAGNYHHVLSTPGANVVAVSVAATVAATVAVAVATATPIVTSIKEIKAQPKIRNLQKESLAMVPTSVAVAKRGNISAVFADAGNQASLDADDESGDVVDEDVYECFLQEMGELI